MTYTSIHGKRLGLGGTGELVVDGVKLPALTTRVFRQPNAAKAINVSNNVLSADILNNGIITSTTAAAVTGTLPTGATLDAALLAEYPGRQVGDVFEFSAINTGATNSFTLATNTGWTDGGGGFTAVAAASSARFRVRLTAANTFTLYKVA